jgi:Cd2+/Zn2+-exporting ATPase
VSPSQLQRILDNLAADGLELGAQFYDVAETVPGATATGTSERYWSGLLNSGTAHLLLHQSEAAVKKQRVPAAQHEHRDDVRTTLRLDGICCSSEIPLIENLLKPLPGISRVTVNVPNRTAIVDHDDSQTTVSDLVQALAAVGARNQTAADKRHVSLPRWHVIVSGLFFAASLLSVAVEDQLASVLLPATCAQVQRWTAGASIALGWPPILKKAWTAVTNKILDINMLMSLAVFGAISIEEHSEGAAVVFLFAISGWLEDCATEKVRAAVRAVIALKPEQAVLKLTGLPVPVETVQIGTALIVRPGEKVPIDGIVTKGSSSVDQAAITGESAPVKKTGGDEVLAGTVNQAGYLEITTSKLSGDSAAARLVRLIEDAQAQRSPTEVTVDAFAKIYTPAVVFVAALMAFLPWLFADEQRAKQMVYSALVLLVTSCPCALVISTPITYICALAVSARNGILVKGGAHLETLARLGIIAIDKTGTITKGSFRVTHFLSSDPALFSRESVLALAAGAESLSSHPLGVAIARTASAENLDVPSSEKITDYAHIEGEGMEAIVASKRVQIGNRRMVDRLGLVDQPLLQTQSESNGSFIDLRATAEEWEAEANTLCWVVIDGKLAGLIAVADTIRPEAKEAIEILRAQGVRRIVMLTGDNKGTACAVQQKLQLDEAHAQLLPEEKVDFISKLKLQCEGHEAVAMVGDGINDAPALSRADVGIAMGAGGSAAAVEVAHVALMDSSLLKLAQARTLGVECLKRIRQNVALSFVTKAAVILLTACGYATLWLAIFADVGAMIIVCINGMRVLAFDDVPRTAAATRTCADIDTSTQRCPPISPCVEWDETGADNEATADEEVGARCKRSQGSSPPASPAQCPKRCCDPADSAADASPVADLRRHGRHASHRSSTASTRVARMKLPPAQAAQGSGGNSTGTISDPPTISKMKAALARLKARAAADKHNVAS